MSPRTVPTRRPPAPPVPRVGLFGLLGGGNIGNDGSLEAVLDYLRTEHPEAVLGALCCGPEQVTARYGVPATILQWSQSRLRRGVLSTSALSARVLALPRKVLGKGLDAIRTLRWVRRFDVVIVPGMGVLEATLPLRAWGFPYSLFLLCASGRLCGTKVALVSVGADVIAQRPTRWMIIRAARLAHYRSYRDELSKDAMAAMGVDTAHDEVYPDLAFALPHPEPAEPQPLEGAGGVVGVGVMAYHGSSGDRATGDQIHAHYLDTMRRFVRWLVDNDRRVRLFTGDDVDREVVQKIIDWVRAERPGLDPARVVAAPAASLSELMRQIASVDTVVATRYHNVLCALKLAKPTLSVGYAAKNDVLMAQFGLGEFCQSARSVDLRRLIEQCTVLESRREQLARAMVARGQENARRLARQFEVLSATLLAPAEPLPAIRSKAGRMR